MALKTIDAPTRKPSFINFVQYFFTVCTLTTFSKFTYLCVIHRIVFMEQYVCILKNQQHHQLDNISDTHVSYKCYIDIYKQHMHIILLQTQLYTAGRFNIVTSLCSFVAFICQSALSRIIIIIIIITIIFIIIIIIITPSSSLLMPIKQHQQLCILLI